jgi:hypothetical protein
MLDRVPAEGQSIRGRNARPDYAIDENGCWIWQKAKSRRGYPTMREHRLYWAAANGPIPSGFHIHHKCRVTSCVNPAHLEAIDPRDHFGEHWLTEKGMTLEDIAEIRRLGAIPGVRAQDIADRYGVSKWIINRYWRGESWGPEVGTERIEAVLTCQRPGCGAQFIGRRHKKYCTPTCRRRNNDRKAREAAANTREEQP